jgi:NhaP-type Na+/H+ or K+/H+ antiporter
MSTDDVLKGLGLVLVLAVGAQLVARRLRLPAIVVLLPAGFIAGIATDDVQPDALLGPLYQPFVSIAVGVILFEAGLRLSLHEVNRRIHSVVARLVTLGVIVTWLAIAGTVALLFGGMNGGVALLIGAILVVSGPTVVLPLLAFIRPTGEVRSLLKWEGVLVDPIGAILGVLVFLGVQSASDGGARWHPGELLLSVGTGALIGAVGAAILVLLLREVMANAPEMAIPTTLMVVVATVVAADLAREDAGLAAATVMGASMANLALVRPSNAIDISVMLEFHETLVRLLIGVLFVLVAASVSPHDVGRVMPEALVLVAVMVLLVRPAAVMLSMARSSFTLRERAFVAWMAPRGIVAGATASAFGPELARRGVAGADLVLPIVFVAIFGTVVLYGLTASVVARRVGVAGQERGRVLVVSGHPWARDLAAALKGAGLAVRMWVGPASDRAAARAAGLEADRGRFMVDAVNREAEFEEITDALVLTPSDDFNAMVAAELRGTLGHAHVYRLAPHPEDPNLYPPSTETGILGSTELTFEELDRRVAAGARFASRASTDPTNTDVVLFTVTPDGRLRARVDGRGSDPTPGERLIVLTDMSTTAASAT